ncbi:hypothetical protein GCM10023221_08150 [Luteimicrobium xylanilyticum]|uniref:Nucleoporin NSP1 n=1 Tax=Luteimicrobium xylanilyticum TaxID=1133546 RepID=A0A5P9QC45_9MICO|nr:hypothetical protein [Luteimicrobium xylanilyticum]QFU99018.1 Nucleoporin NSP1 [Luteimicrobium xylanilyticum]
MTAARRHLRIATALAGLTLLGIVSAPSALATATHHTGPDDQGQRTSSGHDWTYDAPTCGHGVTVRYPSDLPAGQANDVNVEVKNLDTGEKKTFNFHHDKGTWSGTRHFNPTEREDWPGWTHFAYTWVQVGGTNYHWQDSVGCRCGATSTPTPDQDSTPRTTPTRTTGTTHPATSAPGSTSPATTTAAPEASPTATGTATHAAPSAATTPAAAQVAKATPAATNSATASPTTVVLAAGGTATTAATAAASTSADAAAGASPDLAETGAPVLPYVVGAALLVAAGGTLLVVRRRSA